MKVLLVMEAVFYQTNDGKIWSEVYHAPFWKHYLNVFGEVRVLARLQTTTQAPKGFASIQEKNLSFVPIPAYQGLSILNSLAKINRQIHEEIKESDRVILRVPGTLGNMAWKILQKKTHQKPYALEVCGDPWEALAKGTIQSPFRPLFRRIYHWFLKKQCQQAHYISYVTQNHLQQKYPSQKSQAKTCFYSDVILPSSSFVNKTIPDNPPPLYRLVHVGSMNTLYKGQETLLKAFQRCLQAGIQAQLTLIGDGANRSLFEELCHALQIEQHVHFLGNLPGSEAVAVELSQADLFLFPSHTEGLPRAVLEAMAKGLPCIASNVGGIPELLPSECLVEPKDDLALFLKIQEILASPETLRRLSLQNVEKARKYELSILSETRNQFYQAVKEGSFFEKNV